MSNLRNPFRRLRAFAIHFEKSHRPIAIFGLRRGGSTMVADAIAASKGVWFVNEPYAVTPNHLAYKLKTRLLRPSGSGHFFLLSDSELERFASYTQGQLNAKFWQNGTCRNAKFPFRADRVCMKILNAPWMLEWFLDNTDVHCLSITRHPAAQALSVMRRGWRFPVKAYADRASSFEPYFTPSQLDLLRSAVNEEDAWKVAILEWAITSYPLRHMGEERVLRLKYEDIVSDPENFTDRVLVDALGLRDREVMLKTFYRPSNSSMMSSPDTNAAIRERDLDKVLFGWRDKVDERMRADGQKILDAFEVSEYHFTN